MRLSQFYNLVLKFGIERDIRQGKRKIRDYADTAILYGEPTLELKKILVGIDIETPEILLADRVRSRQGLDLVISHHPEGKAYAVFYEVMQLQVDLLRRAGISREVAEKLLAERKQEVERRVLPANHMRAVDAACLLDIPFMCVHTPADNHAAYFIQDLLAKNKPKKLKDIVALLNELPEYKEASRQLAGPRIILGGPQRPVGKIFIEMTGGTEGSKEAYAKLSKAGIKTLVCMHLSEEHFKKVWESHLNVVIAGHISSDNLGLNLLLDRLEKIEKMEILSCSGFRRIRR